MCLAISLWTKKQTKKKQTKYDLIFIRLHISQSINSFSSETQTFISVVESLFFSIPRSWTGKSRRNAENFLRGALSYIAQYSADSTLRSVGSSEVSVPVIQFFSSAFLNVSCKTVHMFSDTTRLRGNRKHHIHWYRSSDSQYFPESLSQLEFSFGIVFKVFRHMRNPCFLAWSVCRHVAWVVTHICRNAD